MSLVVQDESDCRVRSSEHKGTHPLVDISVGSRWRAFDLARELHAHGMLRTLHTGYPAFAAARFGLPSDVFRSVWSHEPLDRALGALYRKRLISSRGDAFLAKRFDRIVATRLTPGANLFVGWSSLCLQSLQTASRYGMVTIVERGSTHIEWQRAILLEEAESTGLRTRVPTARIVERELEEYATADYIAVLSRFAASTFLARGIPPERLILNPSGVDLTRFHAQRRIEARKGLRVIHVGQVSTRKGVHYLVSAVEAVPGATLTLVGSIQPDMKRIVSRPCTRVVGAVSGRDLPSHYAAADVFCLLSLEEGLAMVLMQAMAMGLPIIATPNTGADELISDGVEGFIVPIRNPAAVAERLQRLGDDENLRRRMGARARAKVATGFSWGNYGARARQAYVSILRKKQSAAAQ